MGSLICRIELDKKKGILLTVENNDDGITQTCIMDGTAITTKVKGPSETSTITQNQDSIAIKCKDFSVDADTITCNSKQDSSHKSGDDFQIKGRNLKVTAESKAQYKAMNAEIKALDIKIDSDAKTQISSTIIKLASKGLLKMDASGAVTLNGSVVKVGSAVKLG